MVQNLERSLGGLLESHSSEWCQLLEKLKTADNCVDYLWNIMLVKNPGVVRFHDVFFRKAYIDKYDVVRRS